MGNAGDWGRESAMRIETLIRACPSALSSCLGRRLEGTKNVASSTSRREKGMTEGVTSSESECLRSGSSWERRECRQACCQLMTDQGVRQTLLQLRCSQDKMGFCDESPGGDLTGRGRAACLLHSAKVPKEIKPFSGLAGPWRASSKPLTQTCPRRPGHGASTATTQHKPAASQPAPVT